MLNNSLRDVIYSKINRFIFYFIKIDLVDSIWSWIIWGGVFGVENKMRRLKCIISDCSFEFNIYLFIDWLMLK